MKTKQQKTLAWAAYKAGSENGGDLPPGDGDHVDVQASVRRAFEGWWEQRCAAKRSSQSSYVAKHEVATLRPMSEASTTGRVVEILVATDRAGCKGWLIAHYAHGGGEDQPRFRGWFFWTGFDFRQIESEALLGWIPLPTLDGRSSDE